MTPSSVVYDAFLRQITDDMYMELTKEDTEKLLFELLESAIPWFEFPRQSLEIQVSEDPDEDCYFVNDLTNEEIKIIAIYMVQEWLSQQLASVENTRMKYSGSDFKFTSQANHMAKLQSMQKEYERKGFHLQRLYKRRKVDENGVYRSTMHSIMETPVYPATLGNEGQNSPYDGQGGSWDEQI
jgi:hypothetical protein